MRRQARGLVCVLAAILGLAGTAVAASPPTPSTATPAVEETWYVVEVAGEPAGWMVLRQRQDGELRHHESILRLGFRRGGAAQVIGLASGFVETAEGRPVRAWSRQDLGTLPVEASYEFRGDVVDATYRQGEARRSERLPAPSGEWLTPSALDRVVAERLASGVDEFTVRTVDPSLGIQPFTAHWQRLEPAVTVEVRGERHVASRWRQVQSSSPGLPTIVDVGPGGLVLRSETPVFGSAMTVVLADREVALAVDGTPELLVASFVTPDRPLREPRRLERAVYALSLVDGEAPVVPSTGAQSVSTVDGRAIVEVETTASEPAGDVDRERYLAATTYLDHRHPDVAALAVAALAPLPAEAGAGERAEHLRAFVARHLDRKDLNSVLATASEVAATRSGDCTEHAVLLAALLRAAGIPSRTVTGLVYLEQFAGASAIFGYHMWTQALVDGRWVDHDATLARRFDAAHIALATSALDDGAVLAALGEVTPLIGRLAVAVLEPAQ